MGIEAYGVSQRRNLTARMGIMRLAASRLALRAMSLLIVLSASSAFGQATPIFIDDFENGADNASIADGDPRQWLIVTGGTVGAGTLPNFQTENNQFPSGDLYARIFDPDTTVGLRLISSNTGGTDNREQFIANQITTYSFDFLEPSGLTGIINGVSFGYTSADDLNTGERVWRGFLENGELQPDAGNEGAAVPYAKDAVHTIFMIANDTANPLVNYSGGQTLDAGEADVWISTGGASPTFAFAVGRQSPGTAPQGIGFRTFSGDIGEALVDNVLLMPGATFDRGQFQPAPSLDLRIDPVSGQVRIENTTEVDIAFNGYSISSEDGSLDPIGWKSVAAPPTLPGFPVGDGSGNGWEKASNPTGNLIAEFYLEGNSTIPAGVSVSLGHAYNQALNAQDVIVEFSGESGAVTTKPALYGTIGPIVSPGNFNETGPVDGADLAVWRAGFGTATGAVHTTGDANGDGDADGSDFLAWQRDLGAPLSAASGAGVPEPNAWLMAMAGAMAIGTTARRGKRNVADAKR
jgi:hypothetical protein